MQWASIFDACCCLDSNDYADPYGRFDFLLAAGIDQSVQESAGLAFQELKRFYDDRPDWMFGLLSYDLKNETEELKSENLDQLNFPDLFFFKPLYLLTLKGNDLQVLIGNESEILNSIQETQVVEDTFSNSLKIESRFSKEAYISTVEKLQEHILRGDIYEVNFCQEFFAEHAHIAPLSIYHQLSSVSPTPFSVFFKIYDKYILSASPERFICKKGRKLVSQPIKGTARRSDDPRTDATIKIALQQDKKEQAENVMIVDLVRNDLTKNAKPGSVKVEELFGIYGFQQVYQMISTISAELKPEIHIVDVLRNTFPMGSMTGAPKLRAMQLIEEFEYSKRGAYSGSFGYIDPSGDFDFNVVIRSILYNATKAYLSFQVGGAITYAADAHSEYEECLLKASAILKTLGQ